jgi:hypothetical protein
MAGGSTAPVIVDTGRIDVLEEAGAAAVDVSGAISSVICCRVPRFVPPVSSYSAVFAEGSKSRPALTSCCKSKEILITNCL